MLIDSNICFDNCIIINRGLVVNIFYLTGHFEIFAKFGFNMFNERKLFFLLL